MQARRLHRTRSQMAAYIVLSGVLVLVLTALTLRGLLANDWFLNKVSQLALQRVNQTIQGSVQVGSVTGDAWKYLLIEDVHVLDAQDEPVLELDTLELRYTLWDVIMPHHLVQKISVKGMLLYVLERADGQLNLTQLGSAEDAQSNPTVATDQRPLSWQLSMLDVQRWNTYITYPSVLPGEQVTFANADIRLFAAMDADGWDVDVKQFKVAVSSPLLPSEVELFTQITATQHDMLIHNLRVHSGTSEMQASGRFTTSNEPEKSRFTLDIPTLLIQPNDLGALFPPDLPKHPISARLHTSGALDDAQLETSIQLAGLDGFALDAAYSLLPAPALTAAGLTWNTLNLNTLLKQREQPVLGPFSLSLKGHIPLDSVQMAQASVVLQQKQITVQGKRIDRVWTQFSLQDGGVKTQASIEKGRQSVQLNAQIASIWDTPTWFAELSSQQLDAGFWVNYPELEITTDISLQAQGQGWTLSEVPISVNAALNKLVLNKQPIKRVQISALVNEERADANLIATIDQSKIHLEGGLAFTTDEPQYAFSAFTRGLNLSELVGLEQFPTSLYINTTVQGKGFSLADVDLEASFTADSSIINRQRVDQFSGKLSLKDQILTIREGTLNSSIASGSLHLRQNLSNYQDEENELRYQLNLNDISVFRPLLRAAVLQAKGTVEGRLARESDKLVFRNQVQLEHVFYDSLSVRRIQGSAVVHVTDTPNYIFILEVTRAGYESLLMQRFLMETNGMYQDGSLTGAFSMNLSVRNDEGLKPRGNYFIAPDTTRIDVQHMEFTTPIRSFKTEKPFTFHAYHNQLQLDTLFLRSADDAHLEVSYTNAEGRQSGHFRAKEFDIGAFQRMFLAEPYVRGILSGALSTQLTNDDPELDASFKLTRAGIKHVNVDSIGLNTALHHHRINIDFSLRDQAIQLLHAKADLPFRLGDPSAFPDEFYLEPVRGDLRLFPTSLNKWRSLLSEAGFNETGGILSMNVKLDGIAGSPNVDGGLSLTQANLSGVALDSIFVGLTYVHDDVKLLLKSDIKKLGVRVASITASVPFGINFKTYEVQLPSEESTLRASLFTNKLELASFNEFLKQSTIRNLQGLVSMNLDVNGTLGQPALTGNLQLERGDVRLVPANIRLQQAQAQLVFQPGEIDIKHIRMQSGGTLLLNGKVLLHRDRPANLDVNLQTTRFRLSNTRDVQVAATSALALKGTTHRPELSGKITLDEANVYLDRFGTKSVEAVSLAELEGVEETDTPSMYDSLAMNVKVDINRNVWIRNRESPELMLEVEGDVSLEKLRARDLQVFGEINTRRGNATQFGKRFNLEKGNIVFNGAPDNPHFDIRTLYTIRQNDINIWFVMKGTLDEPEFTFESDPPMELENIVSYVLFGRPFNALFAWQQNIAGNSSGSSAAADAAIGILLDRVEALATEKIGLDVIEIDNSGNTGSSGTTIKAGKYLNDRVFLAIQQQISDRNVSMVMINYLLRKNLELILTQSNDNRSGVDIEWRKDY